MNRRVLICGSRLWTEPAPIASLIAELDDTDVVIHGGARGADRLAGSLAAQAGVAWIAYPADWDRYGRAAGYRRNELMLTEGKPTEVHAFKQEFDHQLRRGGTEHMVRIAKAAGVPVTIHQ